MATTGAIEDRNEVVSVLVVDGPDAGRFVAESLELADAAVSARAETDPDRAIEAVADGGVDCVVTDTGVGDVDGFDLLDRVARTEESVRAVVHTAEDDPEIAREAWKRGAAYAKKSTERDRYAVLARHLTGRIDPR